MTTAAISDPTTVEFLLQQVAAQVELPVTADEAARREYLELTQKLAAVPFRGVNAEIYAQGSWATGTTVSR